MKRFLAIVGLLLVPLAAHAANCPGYSYILTNGTVADANQVMSNFNTIMNCANTVLAPASSLTNLAPLYSPTFTGVPTAPTGTAGDNSVQIATDAFAMTAAANAAVTRGLQSRGQEGINNSRALTANDAGSNILLNTPGMTIGFPSLSATYWLDNDSGGDVYLTFPVGTDYRTVIHNGEQVGLAGDGGGFYRIVAAGNPLYTATASLGDNSARIASTSFVAGSLPTQASTTNVGTTAYATGPQAMAGTAGNVATTPVSLTSNQNLAGPGGGFDQLPGGLYIEWGQTGNINSNSLSLVTLPHACAAWAPVVTVTPFNSGGSTGQSYAYITGQSVTGFNIYNAANAAIPYFWIAVCK